MRPSFIAALLPLCLLSVPALAAPKSAPVSVTRLTWHGWDGAVRLSNSVVEAIVVPSIGRIMDFHLAGHPETSPVFVNPEWEGKSVADTDPTTWAAFGGDKLWPSPQSEWPKHNARAWPPDQTFDGDPEVATVLPDGVRLTTPDSLAFAARATRTITLKPGEARLYIAQALIKDPDASEARDAFPVGIWSITQTRGDEHRLSAARFGLPASFRRATRLIQRCPGDDRSPLPILSRTGGLAADHAGPRQDTHKVGGPIRRLGWIGVPLCRRRCLFSEHYPYDAGRGLSRTEGLPAEIYTNGGATAYIEMELTRPDRSR